MNGSERRKRQLDSLRTFPLGASGRARTSAGDHRWRHVSVHGRRARSCADGSVVLVCWNSAILLGAGPGASARARLHGDVSRIARGRVISAGPVRHARVDLERRTELLRSGVVQIPVENVSPPGAV
jgi:hypothetical protein